MKISYNDSQGCLRHPDEHVVGEGHMVSSSLKFYPLLMILTCSWNDMVPSKDVDPDVAEGNNNSEKEIGKYKHQPKDRSGTKWTFIA